MPTYRYRCDGCGEDFEVWQSIKDDALTTHEACGGAVKKVLSPAGIVLKGSGFYKTDSRSGSKAKSPSTKEAASEQSDTSGSEKQGSDTKSADTSDSKTTSDTKSGSGSPSTSGSSTTTTSSTAS